MKVIVATLVLLSLGVNVFAQGTPTAELSSNVTVQTNKTIVESDKVNENKTVLPSEIENKTSVANATTNSTASEYEKKFKDTMCNVDSFNKLCSGQATCYSKGAYTGGIVTASLAAILVFVIFIALWYYYFKTRTPSEVRRLLLSHQNHKY